MKKEQRIGMKEKDGKEKDWNERKEKEKRDEDG